MSCNDMGVLNASWGICGFSSSLYALYQHSPTQQSRLAQAGRTTTRVLAEIKTYLVMLQADARYDLLGAIETFTQSFGGDFAKFTIPGFIMRINNIVTLGDQALIDLKDDDTWGIAMPPLAVVDYLKRMCDLRIARLVKTNLHSELILGLCGKKMHLYNGLEHYVYRLNGKVYSWGQQFNSVEAAALSVREPTWYVGYRIAIT